MKIEEIIKNNQDGTVLFLGRVTNFTSEELSNFLEAQGMNYADKYIGQEVSLVVLSTMMTPLEEQTSYDLYDAKVPELRLAEFEEFYTKHIKPNTLMMSLKLSNDQERLKRLLKNSSFSDEVYLKLFKMYNWGNEGVYDNDENRDVTITFVERFYRPDGFRDPAMVYSPITLSNIARDAKSSDIIDAMLSMPNHEIKQSRKEDLRPKNLCEIVALNPNISYESIRYLLSFNDDRINSFLACNNAIRADAQKLIFEKADAVTKLMLTQNNSLDDTLFSELLKSEDEVVRSLLTFQKITNSRLKAILDANLDENVLVLLGENQQIDEVLEQLIGLNKILDQKLSANPLLSMEQLTLLYKKYGDEFILELSSNPRLDPKLLEEFYAKDNEDVIFNIAGNPSTPQKILDELGEKNIHKFNRGLAINPSTKLIYLEQFALDSELIMLMSKNKTYLASVNSAHVGMRSDDRY
ncbi:Leucine rich repeat variant [hydrothermal vent metagenome]|uniref:Leucine rich repeat variant n=1 Tax=hydrothermal vent metagenome TaxID=652676 RepID=A0A1W1D0I9_9ZZZZ